ncbi:DNA gyrase subunit A [Sulfurivirga sp.]|uniref:DNA gyrase subunit A n=1 Tax=Sulfurivirga sp. TaxID=2614236 RepID=UPI0025D598E4|nr:DNA gyrase subunit A [Sulfurivirga sp.]
MSEFASEIIPVSLEEEMQQSYLSYAMSVIIGRALPDVRDGLKPVHRRVLYAMHELGNGWNRPYKKSARIVGDVIGKYHPHGDSAVYDTIVRMAQPFSMRYVLIDGQGNFGSIDGDAPAAMRYTEIRMSRIAHEMLADIDKETVDFVPNYDGSEKEPAVLPTRIPNLLINGSAGIAVGMATNIPPHNLTETINACVALLDDPTLSVGDLIEHLPGPDFPTGAIINGTSGIRAAYETGRGRVVMRARAHVEEDKSGKQAIIVTELPYQVNKAKLIERIAELVKEKKVEGITALRDESDKEGMRIVIELRRDVVAEVLLNQLYKLTALQSVFGINMVALVDGQPKLLNLKEVIEAFLRHRREVVTRRTIYDLRKAREKAHLLEGLAVALSNIDEMIELIKSAPTPAVAKEQMLARDWHAGNVLALLERVEADDTRPEDLPEGYGLVGGNTYRLSPQQAQAILDMRLHRLTGLEQEKILEEYRELIERIGEYLHILRSPERLTEVVREELIEIREQYGDARRTEIDHNHQELDDEDLIAEEERIITLSRDGYVKTQSLSDYRTQHRGGRGKAATQMKDEDEAAELVVASSHDWLLFFTTRGRVYWKKTWQLPQAGRNARGKPIVNVLNLEEGEAVTTILPVRDFEQGGYVVMATANGTVKRVALADFSRPRNIGIIAIDLVEGDALVDTALTDGTREVMLFSSGGKAIRFDEDEVRVMGRTARGVRGMRLSEGQHIVSMQIAQPGTLILTATENGYGKCTPVEEYSKIHRGGQGVISIKTSERNGQVVAAVTVTPEDEVVLITNRGTLVRTPVREISVVGRNAQGVKLINLSKGEQLVDVAKVAAEDENDEENDNA